MTSPVLVTGGTGRLGQHVVRRLRDAQCEVRVLTRRSRETAGGAEFVRGDLATGEGVAAAVDGAAAIVHCATSSKGDVGATQNLVRAASRAGAPHVVYVSIVGIDHISSWGYPKAKLRCPTSQAVIRSGGPAQLMPLRRPPSSWPEPCPLQFSAVIAGRVNHRPGRRAGRRRPWPGPGCS